MSTFSIFSVILLADEIWRCSRKFMEITAVCQQFIFVIPSYLQYRNKQTPTISLFPSPVEVSFQKHTKYWTPYVINIFDLCNSGHFCFHYFLYLIGFFHFMCGLSLMYSSADEYFSGNVPEKLEICCLITGTGRNL